jgi:hypothetical protein
MTDREKALAAAREIKSGIQPELLQVSRFSVKATADIILKHMQPDRALVEALRESQALIESTLAHVSHGGPTRAEAEKVWNGNKSVLSKWEREK